MAKLKRVLSLSQLTLYGLGNILGAGIYVIIGKIAGYAGYYSPLAFFIASFVAFFSALTYAELSSRYPISAGEAVYIHEGLGYQWLAVTVGFFIALAGMISAATIASGFIGYFHFFIALPEPILIFILLSILTTITVWGVSASVNVAATITCIEFLGLLIILFVAYPSMDEVLSSHSQLPTMDVGVLNGVFVAAFLAFYAFIGFEDMVNVAEEVKEPEKNLPRSIIIVLIITTVLYSAISFVAITAVSPSELATSDAPLALIYERATGTSPWFISILSMFAIINGALIQIIMASRIFYGMSQKKWLPSFLGIVHSTRKTPWVATLLVAAGIYFLTLFFSLESLASATSFVVLSVFALVNLSLIFIKKKIPQPKGVKTYPSWIPVAGFISCVLMVASQLLFS